MCNTSLSVGIIGIYTVRHSASDDNEELFQKVLVYLSILFFAFCPISIVALQFFVVPYNVKAIDNSVKIYYNNLCGLFRGTNFEV